MNRCGWLAIVVWLVAGGPLSGQSGAPGAAPGQEPAKPLLTFTSDAVVITVLIKPDRTADFELVLARLREGLERSARPERQAQAAGWSVFRSTQMAQGSAVYVMLIDPVVKGEEYDITRLIAEAFPADVHELFQKYKEAFVGRGITDLAAVATVRD